MKSNILSTRDNRVPSKLTTSRHTNPWVNTQIKRAIRRKQRAHKKTREINTKRDRDRYKQLQKEVQFHVRRANKTYMQDTVSNESVTRWTKQAFPCSKFLRPGGQLWANTAFAGSQFYSIGVPKFYSWVNVISVYVYNDLG